MADAATLSLLLRQLRLPTMAGCCEEVTDRASSHGWSVAETLATLCEYELAERERRRLERHLKEARLPSGKTLEAFDFLAIDGADRNQLSALALVQELQTAKQGLRLTDALSKLDKYRLLVIDDIGYVKRSEAETSVLFELIAHRYEAGSLLITSNQPFSSWDSIFPDDMMAVAAVDRLIHHAHVVELSGQSYRKREHAAQRGQTKAGSAA